MVRKIRTSIALDKEQLEWIEDMVSRKRFSSVSHGVEYAIERLREQEKDDVHFGIIYKQKENMSLDKRLDH